VLIKKKYDSWRKKKEKRRLGEGGNLDTAPTPSRGQTGVRGGRVQYTKYPSTDKVQLKVVIGDAHTFMLMHLMRPFMFYYDEVEHNNIILVGAYLCYSTHD